MRVLVTNCDSPLGGAVAGGLEAEHEVRRSGWDEPLEPGAATDALVAGVRAVVHFGYPRAAGDADELLEHAARRTYNLLLAASAAGAERCIYVSTLRLLAALPAHLAVTEQWRTRPPSGDPALLACHLGEVVAKECARDRLLRVVTLRVGFPEVIGERSALQPEHGTAAVASADVTAAVSAALTAELRQWQEIHLQSPVPGARYLMREGESLLGFPGPAAAPAGGGQ